MIGVGKDGLPAERMDLFDSHSLNCGFGGGDDEDRGMNIAVRGVDGTGAGEGIREFSFDIES